MNKLEKEYYEKITGITDIHQMNIIALQFMKEKGIIEDFIQHIEDTMNEALPDEN